MEIGSGRYYYSFCFFGCATTSAFGMEQGEQCLLHKKGKGPNAQANNIMQITIVMIITEHNKLSGNEITSWEKRYRKL